MNKESVLEMGCRAKDACHTMSILPANTKNEILESMAQCLIKKKAFILRENAKDIRYAKKMNCSAALIDRLLLTPKRIADMAEGLKTIASREDPVGEVITTWQRPNGLIISKVRVPLGVIAIIYESRPNVTIDCAGLCFKSGNVSILRGGKESLHSNYALFSLMQSIIKQYTLPPQIINFINDPEHEIVTELLKMSDYIDVVIPRGGEALIRLVAQQSLIPVIKHFKGICHVYIDDDCDIAMAEKIALNAKIQKVSVCNAMETLLVHKDIAKKILPLLEKGLKKAHVELRGCPKTIQILHGIKKATEQDWSTEYLDYILSIKIVDSLDEAITHIQKYGSHHSDAIVTKSLLSAQRFTKEIDSACVFVNTSTRFSDGGEFGFGAEIGISTDKLHARGPMGLAELTSYKYVVMGEGQIRN